MREGFIHEFIELRIDPVERCAEWERQDGVVAGNLLGCQCTERFGADEPDYFG